MRLIKRFGLAVMAAVAAMALVGASSASAEGTTLCNKDVVLTCSKENQMTHVHLYDTKALLLNNLQNVTCETLILAQVQGPLLVQSPFWLILTGNVTYTNCSGGCKAEETGGGIELQVQDNGSELSSVRVEGEVLVNCALVLHCVYDGKELLGHGLGPLSVGGNGLVSYNKTKVNAVWGILCPTETFLDAAFLPLNPIYVRG
jgi:hypothetical protein